MYSRSLSETARGNRLQAASCILEVTMASLKSMQEQDRLQGYEQLKKKTDGYYQSSVGLGDYKPFAAARGSFAERNKRGNMVRLRNTAGRIDRRKLRFIVEEAEKHQVDMVHFATCQTVQFHHLQPDQVISLLEDIVDNGYETYGTGGDYPRNIMCSPLSGVDPDEVMNVLPYAEAAAQYLVETVDDPDMPRKLKTAFSGDRENMTHATYRDLGFAATDEGTFDIYAAGGLGPNPAFGVQVGQDVKPVECLYYVQAMMNTFRKYGNTGNKRRARTRYMVEALGGDEAFRQAFLQELAAVRNALQLELGPEIVSPVKKEGDGTSPQTHWRIQPQKQQGLNSVLYHPVGGCPRLSVLRSLSTALDSMDGVELRTSPDQSVYIINLTGREADLIARITEADTARSLFETSTACVGAGTCVVGVRDSQKLLKELIRAVREAGISQDALPKLHISGCPSSCSAQQTAEIGLRGTVKVVAKGDIRPAYFLSLHGKNGRNDSRMGREAGVILEEDMIPFILSLGREVSDTGLAYHDWAENHPGRLDEIATQYTK